MAIIESWKGVCVNFAGGNNKWWKIELHDNGDVISYYGKIVDGAEDKGQSKAWYGAGKRQFDAKVHEKKNKSNPDERYTECKTLDNVTASAGQARQIQSNSLLDLARKQIGVNDTNSNETLKLIERLVNSNIHNITSQTKITFNKTTGLFETPLGIVTSDAITEARDLLARISDSVTARNFDSGLLSLANKYYRLVPKDFGRLTRFTGQELFPDLSTVQNQNDILDSLEASLATATSSAPVGNDAPVKLPEEQLFKVRLHLVDDSKEIGRISDLYLSTLNRSHQCSHLRVRKVWSLDIQSMVDAYQRDGAKLSNTMELWHGSRVGNLLSIMKSGFVVPPANASHCAGRMFGNGVYLAIQSTKSLNYAYGYWGGGQRDDDCFMFLVDAGLGNYKVPTYGETRIPAGYDSFWAKPGKSGIQNDEIIVPRTSQCNPRYLIQFGR